ncbi:MAG: Gfo/Idh/MocA family oxidoreductase, partial [Candidatus Omnitrophica bacterium]|nr:Gfo/Idh/MocA family oxidoreductase [Candidatus Omnitrophota bacterium]
MIKAGIIGCGNVGLLWDKPKDMNFNTHAKSYSRHPKVTLKAGCDIKFNRARALQGMYRGVMPYRDYKTMLAREDLDVVSVCTDTESHYKVLKHIIRETGIKYILAEKPLASDFEKAREINLLARENNVHVSVNYLRRWDKTVARVKEAVHRESLGRLILGSFVYYGTFKNNGIHFLDLLDFFGEDVRFERLLSKAGKTEDDFAASLLLRTRDGAPVYFHNIDRKYITHLGVDLFYENGRVRLSDWGSAEIFKAKGSSSFPKLK